MAIHRGIQSALFYYLSCTPCAEARFHRKRKEENKRLRAERELLAREHPNLYRHPSPSSTNPYWQSEIDTGPHGPPRGKRKQNTLDSGRRRQASSDIGTSQLTSSVNLPPGSASSDGTDSRWNYRPYQREDEELWGSISMTGGSTYDDALSTPQRARTKDASTSEYRIPQLSELHPAIITRYESREEVMWMKQPTPVASVMNGKERASRSRSDSGGSRLNPSHASLSRQVSHRMIQNKLQSVGMSRESSNRTSSSVNAQRHDRHAGTSDRDFATGPTPHEALEKQRSPPLPALSDSEDSAQTVVRRPTLAPPPVERPLLRAASRPQLSTITSDDDLPRISLSRSHTPDMNKENEVPTPLHSSDGSQDERDHFSRRSTILAHDKALRVEPAMLRERIFRNATDPGGLQTIGLRLRGHQHVDSEDSVLTLAPEIVESWYEPGFDVIEWAHEYTKRDVDPKLERRNSIV